MDTNTTQEMTDIHDIRDPLPPNYWVIWSSIVLTIIIFASGAYPFVRYLYKVLSKIFREKVSVSNKPKKKDSINYRDVSLKRLQQLESRINQDQNLTIENAYTELSEIVRWFIEGIEKNQALKKNKSELAYMKISELNQILDKNYRVNFAKENIDRGDIFNEINLVRERIQTWA